MKQTKGIVPVVVSCVIVAVVFATVSFMVPFVHTDTYWIAFAFAWIALVATLGANLYVVMTARSMKSALYRASIPTITIVYLVVAMVVSLIFMANSLMPSWIVTVIQVILLALCLLSLIGGATGANLIENDEERTQAQVSFMQNMRMQAHGALPFAQDAQTRRALTDLDDKLRFADPVSSPATAMVDQQIANNMAAVNAALQAGDGQQVQALCSQMLITIDQRAAICRSTK